MENNLFNELASLDVSAQLEKKGRFSYLSWAYAVDILRRKDPSATWKVVRFDGLPFLSTECGYFVEVEVCFQGVTLSQIHPILDNNNKPILKPNAFQVNTSIQRCLVKAIAIATGLGLYVYCGEDIPTDAEKPTPTLTAEQDMKQRNLMIEKILELVTNQGATGDEKLKEFESKANCKLTEMNLNVLKRVYTLLNAS
jgi:hypothetical protein